MEKDLNINIRNGNQELYITRKATFKDLLGIFSRKLMANEKKGRLWID